MMLQTWTFDGARVRFWAFSAAGEYVQCQETSHKKARTFQRGLSCFGFAFEP